MKLLPAMLLGGFFAGLGDITYACIHYGLGTGLSVERVLQSVAAGLLGPEGSRAGGWGSALIGLAAHFAIAIIMSVVFIVASQVVPLIRRFWYITGPLYGAVLLFVMNLLVAPMSATGRPAGLPQGQYLYGAIFAHVILVGLVIGYFASRVRDKASAADITPDFMTPK